MSSGRFPFVYFLYTLQIAFRNIVCSLGLSMVRLASMRRDTHQHAIHELD